MEGFAALTVAVGLLSAGVTKLTDLVRNVADKNDTWPKWVWNVIPFVLGIAYAVGWEQNLSDQVVALVPALEGLEIPGVLGEVLTGVAIGGFSSVWHEALDALSQLASKNRALAGGGGA